MSGVVLKARERLLPLVRLTLGPPLRRTRRGLAWHSPRVDLRVDRRGSEGFTHIVATHSSPLFRPLPRADLGLQQNKVVNLRIAAARLDGLVLNPGVRLSFWHEVGKPSRRRGFVQGMVLDHGRITAGLGGGLCQMTNLLYWMTLHTPLTVVERWRHSYDVFPDTGRTQPFGSGATCAWPVLDLQIENRTSLPYRLSVMVDDAHLTGSWATTEPHLSRYEIEERRHRITHDGPGLYVRHNELWRLTFDGDGSLWSEELVARNDALMMYAPFLPPAAWPEAKRLCGGA